MSGPRCEEQDMMLKRIIVAMVLITIAGEASAEKLFCDFGGYTVEIGTQPVTFKVCNGSDCKTVPIKWSKEPPGGGNGSIFSHFAELDDKHYIATLVVRDGPDDVHTE